MSQAETKPRTIGQQESSLSLDHTSHPGRPGLDELVPSRYALRVGEIDVMVVSDGVLSLPGSKLGHNADLAATFSHRGEKEFLLTTFLDMCIWSASAPGRRRSSGSLTSS
jgi:hypothetical protein